LGRLFIAGATVMALPLAVGGCRSPVVASPDRLAPWTEQLRDSQPDDPFAAVYVHEQQHLVFIGAKHESRTDSSTFRLIDGAYEAFAFDTVIVEGVPHSAGANPDRLLSRVDAQREVDGFIEGGETVPAVRGARAHGADVWGGEPDDGDIRSQLIADGVPAQDLLGFYTLRSIPQWISERKIASAGDEHIVALIDAELKHNRQRLALPEDVLPDYAAWAGWYTQTNHKAFGAQFDPEETGPLADGRYGSNQVAALISRARDGFLLRIIAQHLNAGEDVLVVFGASHLMILRPALDDMLGSPCYVGSDLTSVPRGCGR
jgi:hypothetical protein